MFIVIEGSDGVGKGTQVSKLVEWLKSLGHIVWETREPTDGEIGKRIRRILNHEEPKPASTEFQLMYTEDRAEHVVQILAHLWENETVVCDRYYHSTLAYGAASGADVSRLKAENLSFPVPDIVLWLNLDVATARARMEARGELDAHDANFAFQERLQSAYRQLMSEYQELVEIDADGTPEEVHQRMQAAVSSVMLMAA